MDIAHQLQKIAVLLTKDGFVPVLKQVPPAAMAAVVAGGVPGQQTPHHGGDGNAAGAQQKMKMVGYQGPSVADGLSLFNNSAQPVEKIVPIMIVGKDVAPLDTANDDVMQSAGGVSAGLAGHEGKGIIVGPKSSSLYVQGVPKIALFSSPATGYPNFLSIDKAAYSMYLYTF